MGFQAAAGVVAVGTRIVLVWGWEEPMGRAIPMETPVFNEPFAVFLERPRHDVELRRGATVGVSLAIHATLVFAALVVPLFWDSILPAPTDAVRAFFVAPPDVAPPPPPPPPPAAAASVTKVVPQAAPADPAKFVAPLEVPSVLPRDEGLSLGVEGGVPGGVEGGVPGGVVGGVVGGLPDAPPPAVKVVRVGGNVVAPKLVHSVKPEYPELARLSRARGLVILEARVDVRGVVKSVHVLRSSPLFDEAALGAVRQWRYQPLLLNGEPTEFILSVTVMFNLTMPEAQ
jgi:protein TonB